MNVCPDDQSPTTSVILKGCLDVHSNILMLIILLYCLKSDNFITLN